MSQIVSPTHLLPEFKLRAELIQPGVIERKTNAVLRGELNYFPVIFPPNVDRTALPVLGYREAKGAVGLERTFWKFFVSPTYNVQIDQPFAYLEPPCASTRTPTQRTARRRAGRGERLQPARDPVLLRRPHRPGVDGHPLVHRPRRALRRAQ